jgi:ethanolamine utilization protein EutM
MSEAIGMVETLGIATSILVADAMLKTADVSLVIQEDVGQAYFTILIEGDVSAVHLAVDRGVEIASEANVLIAFDVIPRPLIEIEKLISVKE